MVGHEEGVEPALLQLLRQPDDMSEIEVGIRPGARIAPGAGVEAHRPHEGAEMKLLACRHADDDPREAAIGAGGEYHHRELLAADGKPGGTMPVRGRQLLC